MLLEEREVDKGWLVRVSYNKNGEAKLIWKR